MLRTVVTSAKVDNLIVVTIETRDIDSATKKERQDYLTRAIGDVLHLKTSVIHYSKNDDPSPVMTAILERAPTPSEQRHGLWTRLLSSCLS